jgi:hypothetical protein
MESTERPALPNKRREILEPLTPQQLFDVAREANRDRAEHIRKEHPDEDDPARVHHYVEFILKHFLEELEDPQKAADGREFRRRAMGVIEEEVFDRRESLQWFQGFVSDTAERYWDHVTAGHVAPPGSSDEYLGELARRVSRRAFG